MYTYIAPLLLGTIGAITIKSGNIVPTIGVGLAISLFPPLVCSGMYSARNENEKALKSFKMAAIKNLMRN